MASFVPPGGASPERGRERQAEKGGRETDIHISRVTMATNRVTMATNRVTMATNRDTMATNRVTMATNLDILSEEGASSHILDWTCLS